MENAVTLATILAVIGMLALLVSIITEVTKDVVLLSKIPVNLQVIVLSLTLTIVTYFAYISYTGSAIIWYYVVATIVAGFVVAYVVLFGWDKLAELYRRFRNIPPIDITDNPIPETTLPKATDALSSVGPVETTVTSNATVSQTDDNSYII